MKDSLWSAVDEEAGQRMIKTNGVDLCTQAFGDQLIMGAIASMVRWPETLCRQLADSGLYVRPGRSGRRLGHRRSHALWHIPVRRDRKP